MRWIPFCLLLLPLACGKKEDPSSPPSSTAGAPAMDRFVLKADPGAALSVNETKQKGPGEEVTVVGRLNKVVKGFATFNLVDASVEYCGQPDGKKCCDTPWDYC